MKVYRADIGTWECFSVWEYEAPDDKAAVKMAFNHLQQNRNNKFNDDADVVQIYCGNVLVWDYYGNGRAGNNDDNALIIPL